VIESLTFRLRGDADDVAFLLADKRLQSEFAYRQRGLVRRTTARGEDGDWLVLTLWDGPASADAGDPMRSEDDACREFRSHIDPDSVSVERFHELD